MGWTAPKTAVALTALTAADWNTFIRDNLNETAPAKATAGDGHLFVSNGVNSIVERHVQNDVILAAEQTEGTSYDDLTTVGPTVDCDATLALLVFIGCTQSNSNAGSTSMVSFALTGATETEASDKWSLRVRSALTGYGMRGAMAYTVPVNPGRTTVTMKYRVGSGLGTFATRRLFVLPL